MYDTEVYERLAAVASDPTVASDSELTRAVRDLERLEAQLALAKAQVLREWDSRQVWAVDGCLSGATWIAHHGETPRAAAAGDVRMAHRLARMPATTAALEAGRIGAAKARLLANTRRDDVAESFDAAEADLVGWCEPLTVEQSAQLLRHWTNTVRPDGPPQDDRDRCELFVSKTLDGTHYVKGRLDAEWGTALSRAIHGIARELKDQAESDAPEHPASWRRAEALAELVRRGTAGTATSPARPSVIAVVDRDILEADAGIPAPLGSACELDGSGRILADTARRLACDSMLTLAITTNGVLLDLGRTVRTATDGQRKALLLRDQGCTFPGCDRPGEWCEAHHIHWWENGGPTDLTNLALLCTRHHHLVHEGGWHLCRGPDGELRFTRPDGTPLHRDRPNHLPLRYPGASPPGASPPGASPLDPAA